MADGDANWRMSENEGKSRDFYRQGRGGDAQRGDFGRQARGGHAHKGRRSQEKDDVSISKTLSSVLRHNAGNYGLKLMKGGYLYVDELLEKVTRLHGVTEEDIKRVVDNNDKKRFTLEMEGDRMKIRANQGHTLQVESLDLVPILSADEFPVVVHGTYHNAWDIIKTSGLSRMGRNHIHFAAGEPGENGVISGMRNTCEVMIHIDLEKALKDGLQFFRSANNVILSPGDEDGKILPCYFSGVVDRLNKHLLSFDRTIGSYLKVDTPEEQVGNKKKKRKNKTHRHQDDSKSEQESKKDRFDENEDIKAEVSAAARKPLSSSSSSKSAVADWIDGYKVIDSAQDSQQIVNHLIAEPPSYVVICLAGQNLGRLDCCIKYLVVLVHPEIYVYHLTNDNKTIMSDGLLDQLFTNREVHKVFQSIGTGSLSLVSEYGILLDGTPVWDIELVFHKVKLGSLELEQLKEKYGFTNAVFKKWARDDERITKRLSGTELDKTVVDELVTRGKLIWDLYDHCHKKVTATVEKALKAEIFKAAFDTDDQQLSEKIKQLKLERKERNKNEKKGSQKK